MLLQFATGVTERNVIAIFKSYYTRDVTDAPVVFCNNAPIAMKIAITVVSIPV